MNNCTAGIDVSKSQFDLAISGSRSVQRFDSGPDGREKLIRRLKAARVDLVVLEATGGYERVIMLELMSAGLTVVRINPRQVRNFARARGRLAKTDAIDALTLVEYGEVMKPPVRQLPDADLIALRDLLARRQQLVDMQSMESCRRRQTLEMAAKSSIAAVLAFLKEEQSAIEKLLDERMAQNDEWMAHAAVLREESGVGPATGAHVDSGAAGTGQGLTPRDRSDRRRGADGTGTVAKSEVRVRSAVVERVCVRVCTWRRS